MLYTSKVINLISFIITLIIFLILNFCFFNNNLKEQFSNILNITPENKDNEKIEFSENENSYEYLDNIGNWYIEIPAINLKAPIAEGTSGDILKNKVGHFEDTAIKSGNIGLAAHNRGYETNYFENLKKLKLGDEIFYTNEDFNKKYIVDTLEIIENTNWNYLRKSEEDKITLITCIENEPQYRRCVQGTAIEN